VRFPFPAYDCQLAFMDKVIQCLQEVRPPQHQATPAQATHPHNVFLSQGQERDSGEPNWHGQDALSAVRILGMAGPVCYGSVDTTRHLLDAEFVLLFVKHSQQGLVKDRGLGAFGEEEKGVPKIIFASRTHSQLGQTVQELKRCGYLPNVHGATLLPFANPRSLRVET
jgi:hypothetical protein